LAQTIGIVGTMILTLYFSKRQIQGLSIDVETKVRNDLGEKVHRMGEMLIERPALVVVLSVVVPVPVVVDGVSTEQKV